MEYSYLNDTLIILLATVCIMMLFLRLRVPAVLGYFIVGIAVGPYMLGLVNDIEHIRVLAEFGVVFLMFSIGLEFSVAQLRRMKAAVLGLGSAQVLMTATLTTLVAVILGMPLASALVLGGIIAMSSTALVTKALTDQVELHTRHGRNSLGILLFQDIMVVPFLILVSMLSDGAGKADTFTVLSALLEGALALALFFAFGHWILRPWFREVARFQSAELFTLAVLLIVLCSAWATHAVGLSFALGAFLAGVMLSETEFRHQVESEIRPFRDVLLGLFFITIGMMLDVTGLHDIWPSVLLLFIVLLTCKMLIVMAFCRLSGWNTAVSMRTALILAHGGEFGFAILILAMDGAIFSVTEGQTVLATMLLSMIAAPLMMRYNGLITTRLMPAAVKRSREEIHRKISEASRSLHHHIIVCGYGRIGRHSINLLCEYHIPCLAIDLDPEQVRRGVAAGQPVSYGDAGSLELLRACGLSRAAALVISLIDFNTTMKIIRRVRAVDTDIPIIVRTRKEMHLYQFYQAGATEVVADTFGSDHMLSLEMLQTLGILPAQNEQA